MKPLFEEYRCLGSLLRGCAARWRERTAVISGGKATAYKDIERLSNQVARALRKSGVSRGDRVGLYCVNSQRFVAAYFGVLKTGATVVPINLLLSAEEILYNLKDSGAASLVYSSVFEKTVREILPGLPGLGHLVVAEGPGRDGVLSLDDIAAIEEDVFDIPEINAAEDVAAILYTSGTTGRPKGAMLTHRNLLFDVDAILRVVPIGPEDTLLVVLPLFHAFGATACMLTPLAAGACMVTLPRFLPDEALRVLRETRATIFMGVPSMFALMASHPSPGGIPSLKYCVSGGAPLPDEIREKFEKAYGVLVYEGDGPTECSPVTAVNPIGGKRKPCSIGLPLPGVEMTILNDAGDPLPAGEIGEISVRGENVMKGYYNMPAETKECFSGEWFRTGDLGYADEDGYFFIVDRKKDMIIVNGMNVYPRMVEEVLYRHPAVADAAVVGRKHPVHEIPRAVIALKPGATLTREELIQFCNRHLGRHEIPRVVEFVSKLPRTPTGKILKKELRD